MPRIFITGSTDGLGRAAAGVLMGEGHDVVLHARTRERAAALSDLAPDGAGVVIGDLSSAAETREIADQVDQIGRMNAVSWTVDADVLAAAIDALSDCAQACNADNAGDLSEQNVTEMVRCIRLCLDCVDVCTATVAVISRQAEYDASLIRPLLEACVAICKSCGDECERHAHMPHCRVCALACRRCERACRELLDALT